MEKKVNIVLNCVYYGFYALIAATALLMWYLVQKQQTIAVVSPLDKAGMAIQYVVILYVIISVAGGLFLFNKIMKKKKAMQDNDAKLLAYRNWGIARICVLGLGAVMGLIAFYWMGGYTSMIWCAAISTLGLYFCKPTLRKMELELQDEEQIPQ